VGLRKRKKVVKQFDTLTMKAYAQVGGRFNRDLAAACAYYPRLAFGKLICEGCDPDYPRGGCHRAHILEDSNIRRCELCYLVDDSVILVEKHTLHPDCLEKVLAAAEGRREVNKDDSQL